MATTWVALLRGINVGSAKRVAMADLRALLESMGLDDVRTLLQSGNAVFTGKGPAAQLEGRISAGIAKELGLDVKVLVRSATQFAAAVDANPFVPKVAAKELHAVFLAAKPAATKLKALDPADFAPDEFVVGDRILYVRLPNGIMGSKLPDWQKALGVTITQRNWNTVTKLGALAGE